MKMKLIVLSCVIVAGASLSFPVASQQEEDVRGAFMTTRPKVTPKSSGQATKLNRRRPKPIVSGTKPSPSSSPTPSSTTPQKLNSARMGLGLTLFMRDSNGLAIRTDPEHEFVKGDHVRFLIETSADGYLYVFNTTDGGQPVMIYPDQELDEAGNYFQAHVPFEIPSSGAAEERLRWLTFDAKPGAEKLYFVFTREPLNAVPIEDDLIAYCRENDQKCPWKPGAEVWSQIQQELNGPVKVTKAGTMGSKQTASEQRAVTRGIGLNRTDPEPSLIMMTASTNKDILVAAVDLIHKSASLRGENKETGELAGGVLH